MNTEPKTEINVTDRDVAVAMIRHGGGFVSKLGRAVIETYTSAHWVFARALLDSLESADSFNRQKVSAILAGEISNLILETRSDSDLRQLVKDEWPEYWAEYVEIAKHLKAQFQE